MVDPVYHYVPILKGKLGEFKAILELEDSIKNRITPLIEVPPIPWNYDEDIPAKTIDQHLEKFIPNVDRYWGKKHCAFVDLNFIPDDPMETGEHPLVSVFNQARDLQLLLVPVTGLYRHDSYQKAIEDIITKDKRGVCIRIETSDIIDDDDLDESLVKLMKTLKVEEAEIDLIIDLKEIQKDQIGLLVRSVRDVIKSLPNPQNWRTLTITATAFPQTMSGFEPNSVSLTSRAEWLLWTTLLHSAAKIPRMPAFGDYTIVHPELLEIDPRYMQLGSKIKYTVDNDWVIVKGVSIKRGGSEQTRALCDTLTTLTEYRGPLYSYGDQVIRECADGGPPGNQTTWVTVGVNHHVTFVVKQLLSYPAALANPSS